jgi:hypothetical protein
MPPKILLVAMAAIAVASSALAQGSTGGTIGQHEKSSSGTIGNEERSEPREQRQSAPAQKPSNASCKLASVWQNHLTGVGDSTWSIAPNGTAVEQGLGAARGHASMSGHTLTITYTTSLNGGTYVMHLGQDCAGGSGTVTVTSGMMTGSSYTAVFTSAH